jgi:hypothetical protein
MFGSACGHVDVNIDNHGVKAPQPSEGTLRAQGQYEIEKTTEVELEARLLAMLDTLAERRGFEPRIGI